MVLGRIGKIRDKVIGIGANVYDMRIALVLGAFLSVTLWWVPILGPAVAGYVCGRKCGSAYKGILCSAAAAGAVLVCAWGLAFPVLAPGGFPDTPADLAAGSIEGLRGLAGAYLATFFHPGTSAPMLVNVLLTLVFGLVGGTLAGQIRKETADLLATGAVKSAMRPPARSMEAYDRSRTLGFESFEDCMESQRISVNLNPDSKRSDPGRYADRGMPPSAVTPDPADKTVQGGRTSRSDGPDPFSGILDRSTHRKK